MRHSLRFVLLAALAAACGGSQNPPLPPPPPMVQLLAPETNVVGSSFKLRVNVTGCERVEQLQLEQSGQLVLTANYKGANTEIEVPGAQLTSFYGKLGMAADLTLRMKAICGDRQGISQPVGLKFFWVASVVPPSENAIAMPDAFVAEGGVSGTPTTFLGCAATSMGNTVVRMNQAGQVTGLNPSPPFPCNYYATISEKVAGGLRWLYQPGQGAYAFDTNSFNITNGISGDSYGMFAAAPDGDALIWDSLAGTMPALSKLPRNAGTFGTISWVSDVKGIVNGQPAFDMSTGLVLVPTWRVPFGGQTGTQSIQYVNYATGAVTGELNLVTQRFEFLQPQDAPQVAFSPDGRTIYIAVPVQGQGNASAVIACGTQGGGGGCTPRWRSPNLDAIVRYLIPFAGGTKVAAIATDRIWFLEESSTAQRGAVLNPGGLPTTVSGNLFVCGAQAGFGSDFYLFACPDRGMNPTFATEIIAFDNAANGEVYRYSLEGGETAQNALTMAVDEIGTVWLRIGLNQVKPLTLSEYRSIRGATGP